MSKFKKDTSPAVIVLERMQKDLATIQNGRKDFSSKGFRSSAANLLARRYMRKK